MEKHPALQEKRLQRYYTLSDLEAKLGVSRPTLRKLLEENSITVVRLSSKATRVSEAEVRKLLKAKTVKY